MISSLQLVEIVVDRKAGNAQPLHNIGRGFLYAEYTAFHQHAHHLQALGLVKVTGLLADDGKTIIHVGRPRRR